MKMSKPIRTLMSFSLAVLCVAGSASALGQAKEQRVWVEVMKPADGSQCEVRASFKGDSDNCSNDAAMGRADCSKDGGCVCTRQEKKIQWSMKKGGKDSFSIAFNQGSENPFVQKGSDECNFRSNKEGNLRCQVKGKDVTKGVYRYSIDVPECKPLVTQFKIY